MKRGVKNLLKRWAGPKKTLTAPAAVMTKAECAMHVESCGAAGVKMHFTMLDTGTVYELETVLSKESACNLAFWLIEAAGPGGE